MTILPMQYDMSAVRTALEQYAASIFCPTDTIEIRRLPSKRSSWHKAADLPTLAAELVFDNQGGDNIYIGVNPRNDTGGTKASDITVARCLAADFDGLTVDKARERWQQAQLPAATLAINSGHGVHVYLRLKEPLQDLTQWTLAQKRLSAALGSDPKIHDPPRILRLPGFLNLKDTPVQAPLISACPERSYELAELLKLLPPLPAEAMQGPPGGGSGSAAETPKEGAFFAPPASSDTLKRARAYLAKCEPAISGQGGHDQTFKVACYLVKGFHLSPDQALTLLLEEYNPRCQPPWSEQELRHKVQDAELKGEAPDMLQDNHNTNGTANGHAKTLNTPSFHCPVSSPKPPDPPAEAAFHGLAGQLVHAIQPHSEADPVGLLVQTLAAFGTCIGRTAHFTVEGDTHYLNLFGVLVGTSSKGRKGSSWSQVNRFFSNLEPNWTKERVKSGLSSGEGLIWALRDPIVKRELVDNNGTKEYEDVEADPGVEDKRLLCYEPEFAALLKMMDRQANTLSPLLRQFWDGTEVIQSLVKHSPAKTTGAHLSLIGHITADELRRYLSATEQANGFGNRFLWLTVQRSKKLPEGGQLDQQILDVLTTDFREALTFAQSQQAIGFDDAARHAWHTAYDSLSEGKPGLAGNMLARAEAQVRRLACLYALLDFSPVVQPEHLQAALALWKYVEDTVHFVFGISLGDPVADEILLALKANPDGLTRDDIRNFFNRHRTSHQIARALGILQAQKLAYCEKNSTGGRPEERWFAGEEPAPKAL